MAGERLYKAYVVRLWPVHQNAGLLWRASIEDIHTGERRAFPDLAGLVSFLEEATAGRGCDEPKRMAPGEQQDVMRSAT